MSIVARHGPFVIVLVVAMAFTGRSSMAESGGGSSIKVLLDQDKRKHDRDENRVG